MPVEYIPLFVLVAVATLFGLLILAVSIFLGPRGERAHRMMPYESGITPQAPAHIRFPVKFYLVALLFIVFDIGPIFFYPWALTFPPLLLFAFFAMPFFSR